MLNVHKRSILPDTSPRGQCQYFDVPDGLQQPEKPANSHTGTQHKFGDHNMFGDGNEDTTVPMLPRAEKT